MLITDGQCKIIRFSKNDKCVLFVHKADILKEHYLYFILFLRKEIVEHRQIETRASKWESGNVCTYCERWIINLATAKAAKCDYSFNNLLSTIHLFMLSKFNISQVTKLFTYQTFLTSF